VTEFTNWWDDMTELDKMQAMYWDMYKDAYGVRPRGVDTASWTVEDFEEQFKMLGQVIENG
jgi:hypothetical protein